MEKVIGYQVVKVVGEYTAQSVIEPWLRDGWVPYGPPAYFYSDNPWPEVVVVQALVKYETAKNEK